MPEEAEIVSKIFNMYLSGLGINSISAKLNREAIEGNGRQWNNTAIRYILTNEKYIGDSLTQKHYTPPMLPLRCIRNKGERDKFYISNTHEAIISRNDFEAVQKLLSDRNIKTIQTRKRYLFSHMIICSHCGWSYRMLILLNFASSSMVNDSVKCFSIYITAVSILLSNEAVLMYESFGYTMLIMS